MSDTVQNGKGDKKRPTNEAAYSEGWDRIFGKKKDLRTSDEWCNHFKVIVLDPDGWNREDLANSWAERISEDEFQRRLVQSTTMGRPESEGGL